MTAMRYQRATCAPHVVHATVVDMSAMLFWEVAGWAGAGLVLTAFALVSMSGSARTVHHVVNLFGGLLLLGASVVKDAWFSVALNGAWIIIAGVAIAKVLLERVRSTS